MQQLSPELLKLLGLDQHLASMVKALSVIPSLGAGGDYEKQRFAVVIVVKISKTTQVHIEKSHCGWHGVGIFLERSKHR